MIRQCDKNDLDAIMNIWLSATLQSHDFIPASYWWQHQEKLRHEYLEQAEIWVEENQGQIDGFFALNGHILSALFVRPDKQRNGIGRRLLTEAKKRRNELKLYVYANNDDAVRFYTRHQFHISGQQLESTTHQPELTMQYKQVRAC